MFTDLKKKMANQLSSWQINNRNEFGMVCMNRTRWNNATLIKEIKLMKIDKLRIAREREQLRNKGSTFYTPLSSRMLPFLSLPLALAGNPHHLMHTILNDLDQEFVQIQWLFYISLVHGNGHVCKLYYQLSPTIWTVFIRIKIKCAKKLVQP